jgi:hypothetical protein
MNIFPFSSSLSEVPQHLKEGINNIIRATIPTAIGADRAQSKVQAGNTSLLEIRDATICVNLTCGNIDYMPLEQEKCHICGKKLRKTTKQQEPPYVRL